jgi:hypothetical protein
MTKKTAGSTYGYYAKTDSTLDSSVTSVEPGVGGTASSIESLSKSKIEILQNAKRAMTLKTESITLSQIPETHQKARDLINATDTPNHSSESVSVLRHYCVVEGALGARDPNVLPPEAFTVIYEFVTSGNDQTDQHSNFRDIKVRMLGQDYGVLARSGAPSHSSGDDNLSRVEGGIPEKFKRPVQTTEVQNKNAYLITVECKRLGFNNKEIANFLGMALGESGLVPKSELGPSKNMTVLQLRTIYEGRLAGLSDAGVIKLRDSGVVKFFNYVYHGPIGSEWFNKKFNGPRGGPGITIGGYKYRGKGFIQHTGYAAYKRLGRLAGKGDYYFNNPELLNKPEHAAPMLAAFYKQDVWKANSPKKGLPKDFTKIEDTYEATYGGQAKYYSKYRLHDIQVRGGYAANFLKKLESGEWKNWKDGGTKVAKTKKADSAEKEKTMPENTKGEKS